ncbi:glycosyltransferase family 2 protein [Marinobacter lacisalsi]|uniref:Glycosyltransferase family 2 protein n=1 Tax=Marinobacter lacisalsi TaxID=475979 RepID=A0ABV8QDT8_9GAMM
MKSTPLVSVIMPAFNSECYIGASVESVLSQDFDNFELIIVDDGSTDKTKLVIDEVIGDDSRVRVLSNGGSKGVSGARNTGIAEAKGDWIAFLDSDDLWCKESLRRRVQTAERYGDCEVITSDYNIWYPGEIGREYPISCHNSVWRKYLSEANSSGACLVFRKPVEVFIESTLTHTSVIMVKSSLLRSLGGFDESLKTYEDVFLWLKLAAYSRGIVYIPFVGAKYRQRDGSLTHSGEPEAKAAAVVFGKLLRDPAFYEYREVLQKNINHHLLLSTYWYRNNGHKIKAIMSALHSVFNNPGDRRALRNLLASLLLR